MILFGRKQGKKHGLLLDRPFDGEQHCLNCGAACCRGFPAIELTPAEYTALQRLGAIRLELLLDGHSYLIIENGCEFLVNDRCGIYDQRPSVCRRFTCRDI